MSLTYVGGTSGGGTGATYAVSLTGLTGGIASAPAAGDLVLVVSGFTQIVDGNPGVTTPTGYTELADLVGNDSADANLSVSWKLMGSTPDTSVTVSGPNSAAYGGATVIHVWRNASINAIDVTTTTATGTNGSRPNPPAITPVSAEAVIIACGFGTGGTTQTTMTTPSGMANGISFKTDGTTYDGVASVASFESWVSGAYNPAAWTGGTTANTDSWAAATVALRPTRTGSMADLEDPDTFAATGEVIVEGALSVSETGADTFEASGIVVSVNAGTFAVTEVGSDNFASTGQVIVEGALAVSETGSDLFDSQGSAIPNDIVGDLHGFESGSDTITSSGKVLVQGSLAVTEQNDTFTASGKVIVEGSLASSETGSDVMDSQGSTVAGDLVGDLHGFEENDTLSASGKVIVKGSLAGTETGQDVFQGVLDVHIRGALTVSETGSDVLASTGKVIVQGEFNEVETGQDVFVASAGRITIGSASATESGSDVFRAAGGQPVVDNGGGRVRGAFRPVREVTVRVGVSQKLSAKTRAVTVSVTSQAVAIGWAPGATIKTRPVHIFRGVQPEVKGRVSGGTRSVVVATDFKFAALPVMVGLMGYSSPVKVTTTTAQIVMVRTPSVNLRTAPTKVKAVVNPTDDELLAITAALKQARMKQMQSLMRKFK